jgi:hypothetical protein
VATTVKALGDALVQKCGVDPDRVRTLSDPQTPFDLGNAVAALVEEPGDPLLFYYVGHGLVCDNGQLHLATAKSNSRTTRVALTAQSYDLVRRNLLNSAARSVVVVLDCCFSGRGIEFLGPEDQYAAMAEIGGGFVLTSAARNQLALAPKDQPYTAFSGQLGTSPAPSDHPVLHRMEGVTRVPVDQATGRGRCRSAEATMSRREEIGRSVAYAPCDHPPRIMTVARSSGCCPLALRWR